MISELSLGNIAYLTAQRDRAADRKWQLDAFDRSSSPGSHLESAAVPTAQHGTGFESRGEAVALHLEERSQCPTLTVWGDGRMVKVKCPEKRRGGGRRGKAGDSRASRKRLLEKLHTIDSAAGLPQMITLTYPDFFPTMEDAKRVLFNFFKRLYRERPEVSAIWRVEEIDRKSGVNKGQIAPHFHLLTWGGIEEAWLKEVWFEVCGRSDYANIGIASDVIDLNTWASVVYCGKDMSKPGMVSEDGGRRWGVHNSKHLPVKKPTDVLMIEKKDVVKLQRTMRRLQRSRDVLQGLKLRAAAQHPDEKRPLHTMQRARAAFRRAKRGRFRHPSRTCFTENPMEWLAWACQV